MILIIFIVGAALPPLLLSCDPSFVRETGEGEIWPFDEVYPACPERS